jgi:cytochrome c-type biogenesis protein CcmH
VKARALGVLLAVACLLGTAMSGVAISQTPPAAAAASGVARPTADDPVLEKRLLGLTKELRCLVCQNESIADSHAPLAVDMRNQIREQMRSGMSDRQVIEFMVARYGDFVRFRPPLQPTTLALWFGPALLLLAGLAVLVATVRRRRQALTMAASAPAGLSEGEQAQLSQLARSGSGEPATTGTAGARPR